ncbi:hypothetical protein D3879_06440 [Pseudomonas cavernicola]|uniref:Uncharacterized protein n=2 Tax=Pseudomonas cavernicola TaxID=2320866 RepID=A0A418XKE7_9PSED|nr:hypothetical protein D3879_06440 [Pseudomonas cavernicola]
MFGQAIWRPLGTVLILGRSDFLILWSPSASYDEYKRVFPTEGQPVAKTEIKEGIPLSIRLPNGGPNATIDLPSFVDYWCRKGILSMPISQRAKPFKDFEPRERFSVEALVRVSFISESYRNTMQVTTEVAQELIATGLFKLVKFDSARMKDGYPFVRSEALVKEEHAVLDIEKYSRAVKCLEIVEDVAVQYVKEHKPSKPISDNWHYRIPG